MNGADALVTMLSAYGVEVIFGVPGDTNVALYEALRTSEAAPRHILCRDERSAVFMADCYARLSGKPGVAVAVTLVNPPPVFRHSWTYQPL